MKPNVALWLTRLYPRAWRQRYGAEFLAHLETKPEKASGSAAFLEVVDIVRSVLIERVAPSVARNEAADGLGSFSAMICRPAAFLPPCMSLVALLLLLGEIAWHGVPQGGDEGAVAHLWQLLVAGQLPLVLWFTIQGFRRAGRTTFAILGLHGAAGLAAIAPVFLLHL